jgi:hypothetical protein
MVIRVSRCWSAPPSPTKEPSGRRISMRVKPDPVRAVAVTVSCPASASVSAKLSQNGASHAPVNSLAVRNR